MNSLKNKKILIGVCGGIAAYKMCELVNFLLKEGAEVRVIMTTAACQFVSPLTFQTLSSQPVYTDVWPTHNSEKVEHIDLAHWADLIVVAPATANIIGKISHGLADNFLSTVIMASYPDTPVLIVPAMNTYMWRNPIVQKNVAVLESYPKKYIVMQTRSGVLACKDEGEGKIATNVDIVNEIKKTLCV